LTVIPRKLKAWIHVDMVREKEKSPLERKSHTTRIRKTIAIQYDPSWDLISFFG
jgi:hypothetical protein